MPDILDPETDHGAVYQDLVAHPGSLVSQTAERTGLPETVVRAALAELAGKDVVVAVDPVRGVWDAHPPAWAVETLLQRDLLRHAVARQTGGGLERLYRLARREAGHYDGLEIVEGRERFLAAVKNLHRSCRRQVRIIDVPPYYGSPEDNIELEALQCARMPAGVTYRTLYYEAAFDDPVEAPLMARKIEAGEQARILADPPLKLLIRDDDLALLPLPGEEFPDLVVMLIRPSRLLEVVTGVFETLWRSAIPASADGFRTQLDDKNRQILTLMASGATDDAIARRLGLGRRTVVRRVSALQRTLGASTRFQAGVQAARRGWL